MTTFVCQGPFRDFIKELVLQKRALGYKYESCEKLLNKFDQFSIEYGCTQPILSKDLMNAWLKKRPNEAQATLRGRAHVVRQLAIYMANLGYNAYVLPKNTIPKGPKYMPYIFSNDELAVFFKHVDACRYCVEVPIRHWMMPLLFRMLYSSGLRISEALHLRIRDVDLESGILTIMDGKFNKDRLIPLSEELLHRCNEYVKKVHLFSKAECFFFPCPKGQPMTQGNVYKNFRKFLWKARISHGGWGKGPRIHDFRHTFAVHCLRRWVLEGKDLAAYLPVLKTYLGHHSFSDTSQYLRLTAELFPDITAKVEHAFGYVIPKMVDNDRQTD